MSIHTEDLSSIKNVIYVTDTRISTQRLLLQFLKKRNLKSSEKYEYEFALNTDQEMIFIKNLKKIAKISKNSYLERIKLENFRKLKNKFFDQNLNIIKFYSKGTCFTLDFYSKYMLKEIILLGKIEEFIYIHQYIIGKEEFKVNFLDRYNYGTFYEEKVFIGTEKIINSLQGRLLKRFKKIYISLNPRREKSHKPDIYDYLYQLEISSERKQYCIFNAIFYKEYLSRVIFYIDHNLTKSKIYCYLFQDNSKLTFLINNFGLSYSSLIESLGIKRIRRILNKDNLEEIFPLENNFQKLIKLYTSYPEWFSVLLRIHFGLRETFYQKMVFEEFFKINVKSQIHKRIYYGYMYYHFADLESSFYSYDLWKKFFSNEKVEKLYIDDKIYQVSQRLKVVNYRIFGSKSYYKLIDKACLANLIGARKCLHWDSEENRYLAYNDKTKMFEYESFEETDNLLLKRCLWFVESNRRKMPAFINIQNFVFFKNMHKHLEEIYEKNKNLDLYPSSCHYGMTLYDYIAIRKNLLEKDEFLYYQCVYLITNPGFGLGKYIYCKNREYDLKNKNIKEILGSKEFKEKLSEKLNKVSSFSYFVKCYTAINSNKLFILNEKERNPLLKNFRKEELDYIKDDIKKLNVKYIKVQDENNLNEKYAYILTKDEIHSDLEILRNRIFLRLYPFEDKDIKEISYEIKLLKISKDQKDWFLNELKKNLKDIIEGDY